MGYWAIRIGYPKAMFDGLIVVEADTSQAALLKARVFYNVDIDFIPSLIESQVMEVSLKNKTTNRVVSGMLISEGVYGYLLNWEIYPKSEYEIVK